MVESIAIGWATEDVWRVIGLRDTEEEEEDGMVARTSACGGRGSTGCSERLATENSMLAVED
jgi:hypothetical protein